MTIVNCLVLVYTSLMVLLVRLLYPKTPISEEKVLMSSYLLPQSSFLSGLSKHFLMTVVHETSIEKDRSVCIIRVQMFFDRVDRHFIGRFHFDNWCHDQIS